MTSSSRNLRYAGPRLRYIPVNPTCENRPDGPMSDRAMFSENSLRLILLTHGQIVAPMVTNCLWGNLMFRKTLVVAAVSLSGCAANQEAMLNHPALQTFQSEKSAGVVAGCAQQRLNNGPTMGTDGQNFWVTRQSAMGTVVRYDFRPNPSGAGSIVEYRSRLKINNGLDKVKSCL